MVHPLWPRWKSSHLRILVQHRHRNHLAYKRLRLNPSRLCSLTSHHAAPSRRLIFFHSSSSSYCSSSISCNDIVYLDFSKSGPFQLHYHSKLLILLSFNNSEHPTTTDTGLWKHNLEFKRLLRVTRKEHYLTFFVANCPGQRSRYVVTKGIGIMFSLFFKKCLR